MKNKTFVRGLICAIGAIAILLAMEASEKNWVFQGSANGDAGTTVSESAGAAEAASAAAAVPEGALTGTAQGFGGDVTVALTMDGSTITAVDITGPNETPEVGGAAIPTLQEQVLAAQGAEIDGVSGATFTSDAVRQATAAALASAGGAGGAPTGTADGFGGPVTVTLTMDGDAITAVDIAGSGETPEVGGAAIPTLAEQVLAAQGAEIDGVSGASFTSEAVRQATAAALASAAGQTADAAPRAADGDKFIPGTYSGSSKGFGGDVDVTVTVSENAIEDIQIAGDHETENIGSFAVEMLGQRIMDAQTPNVDALTGATVTSGAILRALKSALTEAGADLSDTEKFPVPEKAEAGEKAEETLEADIVIVGAGGAGMTAAINATQAGKSVILLEKMPYVGGNTTKATGGMNAAKTHYQDDNEFKQADGVEKSLSDAAEYPDNERIQELAGIVAEQWAAYQANPEGYFDSPELFQLDTMMGGHGINDPALVQRMAEDSASAIDWLESIGAPLPKVSFSGGAAVSRIHSPEDGSGVGAFLVTSFRHKVEELGINVMYDTKATELLTADGAVIGVKAEGPEAVYSIHAKAVILTTGGFGSNEEMIVHYRPDLAGTVKTGSPGATGDGIVMANAIGAALVDIDQIQLHPTVEQGTSMLITEGVRGDGAILVNQSGVRFTNELLTRDKVSAAELAQEGGYAYLIFDQHLRDGLKATEKYVSIGITTQADTIEELAEKIGMDPAVLADTLTKWNSYVANKEDPDFGRVTGMEHDLSQGPFYAIKIAPGIHHTMGGVKINDNAEVINTEGKVIPGLYAAGEVCGGVHGGNRIGGNAVADIVVFGKVASNSAIAYIG